MTASPSTHDWSLTGAAGQPIYGTTHEPSEGVQPVAHLLICHGFKGYKDYGLFPALADACAKQGIVSHRFNFSHSGMTNNVATFERPDLFEQDRWGYQIADLLTVHRSMDGLPRGDTLSTLPTFWFGHSRGGVTALLASSALPNNARASLAGVVTAASPDTTCSLTQEQRNEMREAGRLASPSSRTGQLLYVGREWLDEIEREPQRFDLLQAVARVTCPLLVVHGEADQTVPLTAAKQIVTAAGARAQSVHIASASHTFNAPNPLPIGAEIPAATAQLIGATSAFVLDQSRYA